MPIYGARDFQQAIDYLQQKLPLPTTSWRDVMREEHDRAFMVAGANKTAIVEDFLTAVKAAIKDGETLQDFRKRFDSIVERHGWAYNGGRNWRSRLIYRTNIRQAYNAGRETQINSPEYRRLYPYVEYVHSGAERYRKLHKSWNGLVLDRDSPFWLTHSPANGYGCGCRKRPVSERGLKKRGKTGPDPMPDIQLTERLNRKTGEVTWVPDGIDEGFDHAPGRAWLRAMTPQQQPANTLPVIPASGPRPAMPPEQATSLDAVLPDDLDDQAYMDAFLNAFDTNGVAFADVLGEPLAINRELFLDAAGNPQLLRDGRHRYWRLLAEAIQQPDEIRALMLPDGDQYRIHRRYIKRWLIDGQPYTSVMDWQRGAWLDLSINVNTGTDLNTLRQGVLLYIKGAD